MLDSQLRARVAPLLDRGARQLATFGATPGPVTALGLVVGIGACVAAATSVWALALFLWLVNRLLDGHDGALARLSGATELGGLLDFMADFVIYAGFVVAVAVAHRSARLACVVLLASYVVNNVALLSFSSLVERLGLEFGDERSLRFTTGLAEGAETILAYVLFCALPSASQTIAWCFAAVVAVTALQRVLRAVTVLGATSSTR